MDEELKLFLEDVDERIEELEEELVRLEEEKSEEGINTLFRAAHTLKGISATYGAEEMTKLTHEMESLFQGVREGEVAISEECITVLLEGVDLLKNLRENLIRKKKKKIAVAPLLKKLQQVAGQKPKQGEQSCGAVEEIAFSSAEQEELVERTAGQQEAYRVKILLKNDTPMPSVRLMIIGQELKESGEIFKQAPSEEVLDSEERKSCELLLLTEEGEKNIAKRIASFEEIEEVEIKPFFVEADKETQKSTGLSLKERRTIRLEVERVEALMNITSELVIEKNRLLQISRKVAKQFGEVQAVKGLLASREELDKKVGLLQDEMLKVRMVPLEILFRKLPRVVRDAAVRVGKEVQLRLEGATVEMDKMVLEELADPLIHILRNAVDHGIQEKGEIKVTAYQMEGMVFIRIEDNGEGIDLKQVKQKAIEKGLVSEEKRAALSEREVMDFLFAPGFSTRDQVSATSGRGVGLDVVKKNIEKLHGSVEVSTKIGEGTSFLLKFPLTLAIIDALKIKVLGDSFFIPLATVQEVIKVANEKVQTMQGQENILLRGEVLPLYWISEMLELGRKVLSQSLRIVVVSYFDFKIGLVIDSLLGEQEIVVYTLGKFFGEVPGIAGATIDAEGRVVLILDVPSLVSQSKKKSRAVG